MAQKNGNNALPLGFGFAPAMDPAALESFSATSEERRRQIAEAVREKTSKKDTQAFENSLSREK